MADFEPNAKRRPLRLLHMSDLHISSDIYADEAFRGFEAALQLGVEKGADVALIAGDLFDNGRVKQELMDQVWSMLADVERPVIVLPGNHDTVLIDGVRLGKTPPNVTVIQEPDGETVFLKEYGLSVWGKPVYDHHPGFRPMAGVPPRSDDNWYVGMAHGLLHGPAGPPAGLAHLSSGDTPSALRLRCAGARPRFSRRIAERRSRLLLRRALGVTDQDGGYR